MTDAYVIIAHTHTHAHVVCHFWPEKIGLKWPKTDEFKSRFKWLNISEYESVCWYSNGKSPIRFEVGWRAFVSFYASCNLIKWITSLSLETYGHRLDRHWDFSSHIRLSNSTIRPPSKEEEEFPIRKGMLYNYTKSHLLRPLFNPDSDGMY